MTSPDREAILAFIRETPSAVGKREIARAFGLHGGEREALKELLRAMEEEGALERGDGHSLRPAGELPRVARLVVMAVERTRILAVPEHWQGDGEAPRVLMVAGEGAGHGGRGGAGRRGASGGRPNLQPGDRLLARISGAAPHYRGTILRKLAHGVVQQWGIVAESTHGGLVLKPIDRRHRRVWPLHHGSDAQPGELVRAELKGSGARTTARILERHPDPLKSGALSAIALIDKGIPDRFSDEALAEATAAAGHDLGPREDWTGMPFVTIDPADARDRDDAVFVEADGDGWLLFVAIADVSWFVRPGTTLDRGAFDRGNSVYFPDRVVPMLPEELSAGACSLAAEDARAVLAARIHVAADGTLLRWSFHRARIRVAANLAYRDVQAMIDEGRPTPLLAVLEPLWGCWRSLMRARAKRHPLDLEIPETRILLDEEGNIAGVGQRQRLDAHRVIEEMMIAANVAAAKALDEKKAPLLYRCHEAPDREKLLSLKEYLGSLGLEFALGQVITPATFDRVLERTKERADRVDIAEAVLRAQKQAYYAPRNTGHFGLALSSYAHFTSPIRRYSDLVVHRSLVRAFALGEGGLRDGAEQRLAAVGEHISLTERRAMEAERDTVDRYLARHFQALRGTVLQARITGVQAFGFFATVVDQGGDGLVPVSALGEERFRFDEKGRFLEGAESGRRYAYGDVLDLKLEEAEPVTGALRFSIPGVEGMAEGRRGRPGFSRAAPRSGKARRTAGVVRPRGPTKARRG